ncbi:hypothetical protein IWW42_005792, partial [Coemansia sp. RSA 1085]
RTKLQPSSPAAQPNASCGGSGKRPKHEASWLAMCAEKSLHRATCSSSISKKRAMLWLQSPRDPGLSG